MSGKESIEANLKEIYERCIHKKPAVLKMGPEVDKNRDIYYSQLVDMTKYIDLHDTVIDQFGTLNIYVKALKRVFSRDGYLDVDIETKFKGGYALFLVFWHEKKIVK